MHANLRTLLCCALFLLAAPALAGDTSVLVGTVVSAETKQPVRGAVVFATSPSFQGEQVGLTDAQGQWRLSQLPEGTYTLRFEMEGFKPFTRADIHLRANRTIRVNVELLPMPSAEERIITGPSPVIEPGSTTESVNVDQEFIRRIAVRHPGAMCGVGFPFEIVSAPEETGSNARAPAWMLPHMIVLVPDGTPQTVYREPSSDRFIREWEE